MNNDNDEFVNKIVALPYQPFDSIFFAFEWIFVIGMNTTVLIDRQLILESTNHIPNALFFFS